MKQYAVVFEESAQADVRGSYDWGCRVWGKKEAQGWVRELRTAVSRQLRLVPRCFPLAPENDEFSEEIRQMMWAVIVCSLQSKSAKFTCSTLGELTAEAIDNW
jgi:plasmid stabilization system protein ParE